MEHGGGWVLGRRDGLGLALEPGLASRRAGQGLKGSVRVSAILFPKVIRPERKRRKWRERKEERGKGAQAQGAAGRLSVCPPRSGQAARSWGGPRAQGLASDVRREGQTGKKGLAGNVDPREGGQQRRGCRRAVPDKAEGHCESRWRPRGPA